MKSKTSNLTTPLLDAVRILDLEAFESLPAPDIGQVMALLEAADQSLVQAVGDGHRTLLSAKDAEIVDIAAHLSGTLLNYLAIRVCLLSTPCSE